MTCIPIPCTMHGATHGTKATHNAQCINIQNNAKNKRMLQKHAKICKPSPTMAFKKTMATKRDEQKGGPTTVRDPLKRDPRHKTRRGTQQTRHTPHKLCDGGHSPSPIRPRTPRRSAHPSPLVENPVDNSSNPDHNVTAIMWKTFHPVENPVENPTTHDPHHSI